MAERKKILITGADGQLGNSFKQLASHHPQFEFRFPSRAELTIDDFANLRAYFSNYSPAICINCAAYTAVDKAETDKEQAFLVNGKAVGQLAAICNEFNTAFIHISTDYVFDGSSNIPYMEDFATNPINVYGDSKLDGEKRVIENNKDAVIIRTSWVYSPFGKNFVKTMLRLMREKPSIGVVDDQSGSPTYAPDLAEAIMTIVSSTQWQPGIFHFTNSGEITWFEFASAIKRLINSDCKVNPVSTAEYPTPAKRPRYSVLNNHKIREVYGIQARFWEAGLRDCIRLLGPQA